MCGIAGGLFFHPRFTADVRHDIGQRLLAAIRHRGPDGEGVWGDTVVSAELDLHEARQLLEARRALEPAAVALAAERRRTRRRTDAGSAEAAQPVTRRWGETALAAHREVHRALYSASHNDVVVRMLDDLWDKSDRYRRVGLQLPPGGEDRTRDFEEHHELVRLVVDGDAAAASDLMTAHIDHSLAAAVLAAPAG